MKRIHFVTASAALLASSLSPLFAASKSAPAAARTELQEIDAECLAVSDQAFKLTAFAGEGHSDLDLNVAGLSAIKEDVNNINARIRSLNAERDLLTASERADLDQIAPLANQIATETQQAILTFNANTVAIWYGPYKDETAKVSEDAHQMASLVSDALKLEKTQSQEQQLERNLHADSAN